MGPGREQHGPGREQGPGRGNRSREEGAGSLFGSRNRIGTEGTERVAEEPEGGSRDRGGDSSARGGERGPGRRQLGPERVGRTGVWPCEAGAR